MGRFFRSLALLLPLAVISLESAEAQGNAEPSATPYRPSVSTPAALSAPGWLEVEGGIQRSDLGGGTRRDSAPATFKFAFTPDWGLRVSGDAWIRQREDDQRTNGSGDTSIVLKRRFELDPSKAFGLEAGVTLPTARRNLGNDKASHSINAIYSADMGDLHTDLNLLATRFGRAPAGTSRSQFLWAAALSRAFTERWGLVGEFSGTRQKGERNTGQVLVAASFAVSKRLVLDAGVARSLQSGGEWSAFSGFTWTAAKLY